MLTIMDELYWRCIGAKIGWPGEPCGHLNRIHNPVYCGWTVTDDEIEVHQAEEMELLTEIATKGSLSERDLIRMVRNPESDRAKALERLWYRGWIAKIYDPYHVIINPLWRQSVG